MEDTTNLALSSDVTTAENNNPTNALQFLGSIEGKSSLSTSILKGLEQQIAKLQTSLQEMAANHDYINAGIIQKKLESKKHDLQKGKAIEQQIYELQTKLQAFAANQDYIHAGETQKLLESKKQELSNLANGVRGSQTQHAPVKSNVSVQPAADDPFANVGQDPFAAHQSSNNFLTNSGKSVKVDPFQQASQSFQSGTGTDPFQEAPDSDPFQAVGPSSRPKVFLCKRKNYPRQEINDLYERMIQIMVEANRPMTVLDIRWQIPKKKRTSKTIKQLNFLLYDNQRMGFTKNIPPREGARKLKPRWVLVGADESAESVKSFIDDPRKRNHKQRRQLSSPAPNPHYQTHSQQGQFNDSFDDPQSFDAAFKRAKPAGNSRSSWDVNSSARQGRHGGNIHQDPFTMTTAGGGGDPFGTNDLESEWAQAGMQSNKGWNRRNQW